MENREQNQSENIFAQALRAREQGETAAPKEEEPAAAPEALEEAPDADLEFIDTEERGEPDVPAAEPDAVGKAVLLAGRGLGKVWRPVRRVLRTFLAPVIKPFQKGADRITRKEWALFAGLIATVAVIVAAPVLIVRIQSTHKVNETVYAPMLGQIFTWDGGTFRCEEDDWTWFQPSGGEQIDATGIPFYYQSSGDLFWSNTGLWYSAEDESSGKLERFSEVQRSGSTSSVIRTARGGSYEKGGFLYDNKDSYVFLETVTLEYNGQTVTLPPLSYVEVQGGSWIDVYSYGDEPVSEALTTDAEATFRSGVRVDMAGDQMFYQNGMLRLLYRSLEAVQLIKN